VWAGTVVGAKSIERGLPPGLYEFVVIVLGNTWRVGIGSRQSLQPISSVSKFKSLRPFHNHNSKNQPLQGLGL
jgi:hypothetical protein